MDMLAPSPIIDAAIAILADGKPRTAEEILDEGRKRGLFDASMTRKHVYTSLSQSIERAMGAGRKPELTEDVQLRFRINRTPDDWPDLDSTGLPPLTAKPQLSAGARRQSRAQNAPKPAPIRRNMKRPCAISSPASVWRRRTWAETAPRTDMPTRCSGRCPIV